MNRLLLPAYLNWSIALSVIIFAVALFCVIFPVKYWIITLVSKAKVSLWHLFAIKKRKSNLKTIVDAYISAQKSKIDLTIDEIEAHYISGGDVLKLINALVMARNAGISLTLNQAMAIDLAGKDILVAVKNCITPFVVDTPSVTALVKDGYQVKAKAKITLKADINRIIGGSGEETIIARVCEELINEIGNSLEYNDFMQNPQKASSAVFAKNLTAGTYFDVLGVNIVDIELGENLENKVVVEEAEMTAKVAAAKAEERKANAVAAEQEMKVDTQKKKSDLIVAESEVPKAIAGAFQSGTIGVMDYYKLENIAADTEMRKKFAENDEEKRNR